MQRIPLIQGHFALVDDQDYEAVCAIGRWRYSGGYAVHWYSDDLGQTKRFFLHRVIMQRILGYGIPTGLQVDHISGGVVGKIARLDNQRANLRLATRSQQQANKGQQINSTSGHRGVNFSKGKWEVRLRYHHKRFSLGRYATLEQAHKVYAYTHILLWGEFSNQWPIPELSVALQARVMTVLSEQGITP